MSVVFFLIGIGIIVAGGFLFAFIWAVRSGQYDDDYAPSVRILFDGYKDEPKPEDQKNTNSGKEKIDEEKTDKSINNKK
ncbi:MAG: cbb3-type cytochrome oxidase assembly protein CcoS [Bacteroidales bacterium]|nr:cbb3-type cytochrome oxidase assembly protein CcoS [Bacteroidales bacterium]